MTENAIKIFENEEFGQIRIIEKDGEPWLVGKDVAEILGYTNTPKAIRDHIDDEDKLTERIVLSGQNREAILINESGLYSLVLSSKLPTAKKFKRWVTSEVLPSIRKHGAYMTPETLQAAILNPDTMIQLCQALKEEQEKRKALEVKVEEDKPKVQFAEAVDSSPSSILVGTLAKLITQNGVKIGQNKLYEWMRQNGYLISQGSRHNEPTQKAMELGLFEVREQVYDRNGVNFVSKTTMVTGKGQQYFINKFLHK